jgi:hypothetical protein
MDLTLWNRKNRSFLETILFKPNATRNRMYSYWRSLIRLSELYETGSRKEGGVMIKLGQFLVIPALALILAASACAAERSAGPGPTNETPSTGELRDVIPRAWLERRTTVEEAERKNLVTDTRLGSKPVPFGFMNEKWVRFKGELRDGDELWEFSSSDDSWRHLAGRAGICIVRKGRIIDSIVTRLN